MVDLERRWWKALLQAARQHYQAKVFVDLDLGNQVELHLAAEVALKVSNAGEAQLAELQGSAAGYKECIIDQWVNS